MEPGESAVRPYSPPRESEDTTGNSSLHCGIEVLLSIPPRLEDHETSGRWASHNMARGRSECCWPCPRSPVRLCALHVESSRGRRWCWLCSAAAAHHHAALRCWFRRGRVERSRSVQFGQSLDAFGGRPRIVLL